MRVLVTGHLGYIGTVLVPVLEAERHDVRGLDTDLYARCTFGPAERVPGIPTVERDLRDVEPADLDGFDAVVHLAALSNDPLGDLDPGLTHEINHRASVRLARAARDAGVRRFVFSSSCSNYGAAAGALLDEDADLRPITAYGESKVRAEIELRALSGPSFVVTSLRNATAYGDSPRLRCDVVVNNLVAWAMTTGRVRLKSDGTPWRPLVHVRDIARAIVLVLAAPEADVAGKVFNVAATRENYQIRDVGAIVEQAIPGASIEYAAGASPDARDYRVNADRFAAATGFVPEWTVAAGVAELVAAIERHGMTLDDVEGPRYQRIAQIRTRLAEDSLDASLRVTRRLDAASRS